VNLPEHFTEPADWDDVLRSILSDPQTRRAYVQAQRHSEQVVRFVCPLGDCMEALHPTDRWAHPVGPSSCPHQADDVDAIRSTWTRIQ
jgi:hypothetical protein